MSGVNEEDARGSEEFLLKNRRVRSSYKGWKNGEGGRGLQLLRPFFNGKVVLMNKSLFPYIYIYIT